MLDTKRDCGCASFGGVTVSYTHLNAKAKEWIEVTMKRLKTDAGKRIGKHLIETHPDAWWFDVNDAWFVDRNAGDREWGKKEEE